MVTDALSIRTAIVTGASRGIGVAVAEALIADGANVVLTSRHQEAGDEAAARLGEQATGFAAHVVDEATAQACISFKMERFGSIDILVNNRNQPGLRPGGRSGPWSIRQDDRRQFVGAGTVVWSGVPG